MFDSPSNTLSEAECVAVFDRLFPQGFAGSDVLAELAPGGWERSPLLAVYHPSAEQLYQETVRVHENFLSLRRADDNRPFPPEPTREEVVAEYQAKPVEAEREVRELVGLCLWDVFSNNHEVTDPDGRVVDLGSFRASGGFLADYLNQRLGEHEYDYISFYMGTIWVSQRADLTPVYEFIFRRLQRCGLDWVYHFPRLQLVDMRPLTETLKSQDEPEWAGYSPEAALAKEQEDRERDQQLAEMRASLDEAHREAIEEALKNPPPEVIQAYQNIYGRWPQGWPPTP